MLQRAVITMVLSLGAATPSFAAPILVSSHRSIYAYVQVRDANGAFVAEDEPAPYDTTQPGMINEELLASVTDSAGTGVGSGAQISNVDASGVFSGALSANTASNSPTTYAAASSHYQVVFTLDSPHSYTLSAIVADGPGGSGYFSFCPQSFGAQCSIVNGSGSLIGSTGILDAGRYILNAVAWAEGQDQTIESTVNFDLRVSELIAPLTPVPEPTSMLLLGTGLAAAGVRRWRQRRA